MAHKAISFKVDDNKKVIILYSNVEAPAGEKVLIEFYLNKGYIPKFEEKKDGVSVKGMRSKLAKDKEALNKFNEIYDTKATDETTDEEKKEIGFFGACKFFNEWSKEQKNKKKQKQENTDEQTTEE